MKKYIKDYSIFPTAFFVFTDFDVFKSFFKYIRTVIKDFFFLQFIRKMGLSKIPIAKVDNVLDDKIPFDPNKIKTYLDFTNFWIKPLTMLIKELGRKGSKKYVIEFFNHLQLCYFSAAKVYKICMTTTNRPKYYQNRGFRLIHFFDPHYLCVPSLHVSLISLVWSFYRRILPEITIFSEDIKNQILDELYKDAIKICEAVLYVKQHSVNCIPAALYMMTFLLPNDFSCEDGIQFLKDLFVNTEIPIEDQKELKDYMYFIFERFLLVGITDGNWIAPIKSWLKEYCINSNQEEIAKQI
jgi:hypothetical protein